MTNSHGFDGSIPADAVFGVYDIPDGSWIGRFFSDREDAQEAANELGEGDYGVVSIEGEDWIKPESIKYSLSSPRTITAYPEQWAVVDRLAADRHRGKVSPAVREIIDVYARGLGTGGLR